MAFRKRKSILDNDTVLCERLVIVKIVGARDLIPASPADSVRRAGRIIAEASRLAPHPKPRGFVVKAKTWAEYAEWRRAQTNPRLW